MIRTTIPSNRLTGASVALVLALALGAGPPLAAQEKVFDGCLGEAVDDFAECSKEADGFWDRVVCTANLFLDALDCVA